MSEYRTLLRSLAAGWCEIPARPGHGRFVSRISQRSANRVVLSLLPALLLLAAVAKAQTPFCLEDADGDGHPIFGNPEVMMNPSAAVHGLSELWPTAAALGDLDGDGDIDAAAVYAWYNPEEADITEVSILLNNGDATFVAVGTYACGDYPTSVAIGDLDGDGLDDLAITNASSGQVSVLFNAGGATFPTGVSYPAGLKPRSSVIADLDGDGDNDLAIMNAGDETVTILMNNGAGAFTPTATLPVSDIPDQSVYPSEPYAFGGPYIMAGDLDGDTLVDLIVPATEGVSVLLNLGEGEFSPYVLDLAESSVWDSAVGDVDNDGTMDVVTANYSADSVSVLCNLGGGVLAPPVNYTLVFGVASGVYNPNAVDLGDLDEDGDLDIIAPTNSSYEHLPILLNNGDGTFGPPQPQEADQATSFAQFAHINGDEHLDAAAFVLTEPGRDKLCVLLGDGTGNLLADEANYNVYVAQDPWYWVRCQQVAAVHIDSDGALDLVVLNEGAEHVSVPSNVAVLTNAGGSFPDSQHYAIAGFAAGSMDVADFDGDGDVDIVVGGPESISGPTPGYVAILTNDGAGGLSVGAPMATGGLRTLTVRAADVDDDGDEDVVASNVLSGDISVFINDGADSFAPVTVQAFPGVDAGFFDAGDLDGDDIPDLAVQEYYGAPGLTLLHGVGDGTFLFQETIGLTPDASQPLMADLNGDGMLDIIITSLNKPWEPVTITVLLNEGDGMLSLPVTYWSPGTRHARVPLAFDLDGDADLDVAASTDAGVSVFLNNGDGTLAWPYGYGAGQDIQGLSAGDLDGNGSVDLVTAHHASATFAIHWNLHCFPLLGDLDNDGDVDLSDHVVLAACVTGPLTGGVPMNCPGEVLALADLDADADVDLGDVAAFQITFGAGTMP